MRRKVYGTLARGQAFLLVLPTGPTMLARWRNVLAFVLSRLTAPWKVDYLFDGKWQAGCDEAEISCRPGGPIFDAYDMLLIYPFIATTPKEVRNYVKERAIEIWRAEVLLMFGLACWDASRLCHSYRLLWHFEASTCNSRILSLQVNVCRLYS